MKIINVFPQVFPQMER